MKLYLSSMLIPTPQDLADLLGRPLDQISVALIPNAKDYFSEHAWNVTVNRRIDYLKELGLTVETVDLKDYTDASLLQSKLSKYDLIWAMGGNTFMLRYEMKRSGFDTIIRSLLEDGIVYGGDSAGALAVGVSIDGIESSDDPEFAHEVINAGVGLIPYRILPHVGNNMFSDMVSEFRQLHADHDVIELDDSQAVIFEGDSHRIVQGQMPTGR